MITVNHITTFLYDLGLPSMSDKTIENEFVEAGGSREGKIFKTPIVFFYPEFNFMILGFWV